MNTFQRDSGNKFIYFPRIRFDKNNVNELITRLHCLRIFLHLSTHDYYE